MKKRKKYATRRHIWENSPCMWNKFAMNAQEVQIYDVDRTHISTSEANLFGLLQSLQT